MWMSLSGGMGGVLSGGMEFVFWGMGVRVLNELVKYRNRKLKCS